MSISKVMSIEAAMARVVPGSRVMMGEFVGAGEPARCIEYLLAQRIGGLTLIANTTGLRGDFLMGKLFAAGLIAEYIGTHGATSGEASDAYLSGQVKVKQFFPMGTWAEKIRAGAVGLGGCLVPVGVGILDVPGLFPDMDEPKRTIDIKGRTYLVEEALTAEVAIIRGFRGDALGNIEFRYMALQNQKDLAMASKFAIAEVSEIVPVGTIPPERVGCPGPFVNAVVQGYSLAEQHRMYRDQWIKLKRLPPLAPGEGP